MKQPKTKTRDRGFLLGGNAPEGMRFKDFNGRIYVRGMNGTLRRVSDNRKTR